jgi:hypothetical protein
VSRIAAFNAVAEAEGLTDCRLKQMQISMRFCRKSQVIADGEGFISRTNTVTLYAMATGCNEVHVLGAAC